MTLICRVCGREIDNHTNNEIDTCFKRLETWFDRESTLRRYAIGM